jgi:repressor of nif and glnA expression
MRIKNDAVIVCAGGILPTAFLHSVGIEVETKYGTA